MRRASLEIMGKYTPRRDRGSGARTTFGTGIRKRRTIRGAWTILLLIPLLASCVRAEFDIVLLPDGSGELRADVAYSARKWPAFFGDPFASFMTPAGFAGMMPPGFVAWSETQVTSADGWRHIRTAAFFDDVRRVVFPAKRSSGEPYAALGFRGDPEAGRLVLRSQLDSVLARAVPLPAPQELGMDGVSIPDAVMQRIRGQMGTLLSGLDLELRLHVPGLLERADGFDSFEGNRAVITVDAQRGAAAFQDKAAVLVDAEALSVEEPRWTWTPAPVDSAAIREHRRARAAALAWWGK